MLMELARRVEKDTSKGQRQSIINGGSAVYKISSVADIKRSGIVSHTLKGIAERAKITNCHFVGFRTS